MNMLTYEQLIEIDGILHEPLSSQQKQLRELEDLFNSILTSQRQAILKEVKDAGMKLTVPDKHGNHVPWWTIKGEGLLSKLDAMEKKV